ncbi:Uncharacterized protein Fot_29475 [Forsythia ovata]|uniref:Uncharacterized protein n=1 Tax=Forsythia ovata TaxID=205694 RepID=A0ABD1TS02_9LAMI
MGRSSRLAQIVRNLGWVGPKKSSPGKIGPIWPRAIGPMGQLDSSGLARSLILFVPSLESSPIVMTPKLISSAMPLIHFTSSVNCTPFSSIQAPIRRNQPQNPLTQLENSISFLPRPVTAIFEGRLGECGMSDKLVRCAKNNGVFKKEKNFEEQDQGKKHL